MTESDDLQSLFSEMFEAQLVYQSALKECAQWKVRLKDDTGGYRGMGDVHAQDWADKCEKEYRAAFDAYVSARFGLK